MSIKSISTWLFLGYILLILGVSSISANDLPKFELFKGFDKIVHFVEYLIYGFLLLNAFSSKTNIKIKYFTIIVLIIVFPIIDEYFQSFIPGRDADVFDGLADGMGSIIGVWLRSKI
jgi:VanZ family protein